MLEKSEIKQAYNAPNILNPHVCIYIMHLVGWLDTVQFGGIAAAATVTVVCSTHTVWRHLNFVRTRFNSLKK